MTWPINNHNTVKSQGMELGPTLIFSYMCRLGPLLEVQKFEFQYFIWVEGWGQLMNILGVQRFC